MTPALRVTRVLPAHDDGVDLADAGGRAWLESVYEPPSPSFVRLNMITSLTGSAIGADGTSETLSSRVDRIVLGVIRQHADVVLVGAQTVRAEGYIMPRASRLAVVTTTGDLRGHRLDPASADGGAVLLVCAEQDLARVSAAATGIETEMVPVAPRGLVDGRPSPRGILGALSARGMRSVVCEGGPTLASQFVEAGVIDEACITVAPVLSPVAAPFVRLAHAAPAMEVAGMMVDDAGFSYLRLRPGR